MTTLRAVLFTSLLFIFFAPSTQADDRPLTPPTPISNIPEGGKCKKDNDCVTGHLVCYKEQCRVPCPMKGKLACISQ
jgi:hypothetical protein